MHPASKKCLRWSVGLFVLGTLTMVYLPEVYRAIARVAGSNADIGLTSLNLVFTFVQMTVFPTGAALLGSAVVIQVLAGQTRDRGDVMDNNHNHNPDRSRNA